MPPPRVLEAHIAQFEESARSIDGDRVRSVVNRGTLPEQREQALAGRHALRCRFREIVEPLDRLEQLCEIGREHRERAERQLSFQHQQRAARNQERGRDAVREADRSLHLRGHARLGDSRFEAVRVQAAESLPSVIVSAERLNHR